MKKYGMFLTLAIVILFGATILSQSAIRQIAGLAVAQTATRWNNVQDGSAGDNLTQGVLATTPMMYDGTNFDRARGDITNGLDVDVTRITGSITMVGDNTPADAYANPTDAVDAHSLNALYNGTTWDLMRGTITNGLDVDVTRMPVAQGAVLASSQTSVDATAGGTSVIALNTSRLEVMLQNIGATDAFCGNTGLTTSNGFKLPVGSTFIDDKFNGAYFCITAASSTTVAVREID